MGRPTYKCEAAFGVSPMSAPAPGDWIDLTPYWRQGQGKRGRDHELGQSQAGEWTIRFRNIDRRFEPFFAGSPYYPNVRPRTHIRITATANAVTYPVARGYVENWEQNWPGRPIGNQGDGEAVAHCVDAFKILSLWQLLNSYSTVVMADNPVAYYQLDDDPSVWDAPEGLPAPLYLYSWDSLGFLPGPLLGGASALHTNGGFGIYESSNTYLINPAPQNPTIEFFIRPDSFPANNWGIGGLVGTISNQGAGAIYGNAGSGQLSLTVNSASAGVQTITDPLWTLTAGVWQHVAFVRDGNRITFYRNGLPVATKTVSWTGTTDASVLAQFAGLDSVITPSAQMIGSMGQFACYATALSPARLAAHYAATNGRIPRGLPGVQLNTLLDLMGWPAALRSIDPGTCRVAEFDPSGSRLAALLEVGERSEFALFQVDGAGLITYRDRADLLSNSNTHGVSQATFGDAGTEVAYENVVLSFDDQDLWSSVVVTPSSGAPQVATDAGAVALNGDATLANDAGHLLTDSDAMDKAGFLLGLYKTFRSRPVSVSFKLAADDATNQALLGLGTDAPMVTIKRRPQGGGAAITSVCQVEGLTWSISPVGSWDWTLQLVPAPQTAFWLLQDAAQSQLETTTVPGW